MARCSNVLFCRARYAASDMTTYGGVTK